jgi:hypothetical protein
MPWRPELTIEEIPAPQRIAPHAVAIAADVDESGEEVGNGRLVLLARQPTAIPPGMAPSAA